MIGFAGYAKTRVSKDKALNLSGREERYSRTGTMRLDRKSLLGLVLIILGVWLLFLFFNNYYVEDWFKCATPSDLSSCLLGPPKVITGPLGLALLLTGIVLLRRGRR